MDKFVLLKQSFPISKHNRYCDLYKFLDGLENININEFDEIIKKDERYLYRVGKENGEFKVMHISLKNFEIAGKKYKIFA